MQSHYRLAHFYRYTEDQGERSSPGLQAESLSQVPHIHQVGQRLGPPGVHFYNTPKGTRQQQWPGTSCLGFHAKTKNYKPNWIYFCAYRFPGRGITHQACLLFLNTSPRYY